MVYDMARHGMARTRYGMVWYVGTAWYGTDTVWHGMAWYVMDRICYGMVWHVMDRMVWYVMIYDMTRQNTYGKA
jgi:hypothetical protein